jgi:hypothetical protein
MRRGAVFPVMVGVRQLSFWEMRVYKVKSVGRNEGKVNKPGPKGSRRSPIVVITCSKWPSLVRAVFKHTVWSEYGCYFWFSSDGGMCWW